MGFPISAAVKEEPNSDARHVVTTVTTTQQD